MTATSAGPAPSNLAVFDVARALAALAVLLSHARSFVFLEAVDEGAPSTVGRAFLAVSGLGHQAVIIFFVLSGALVTRSLLRLDAAGRLSALNFAVPRLTRLWVVLVPGLIVGAFLDHLGLELTGAPAGYGLLRPALPGAALALDPATFLGNLAFLQTIAVPTYGTNGALWSLSNEVWYYAGAFSAFWAFGWRRRPVVRIVGFLGLMCLAALVMTPGLWCYLPVWLVGAALASTLDGATQRRPAATGSVALAIFLLVLAVARISATRWPVAGDYALACATAVVLWAFAGWRGGRGGAMKIVRRTADLSFSLYVSHMPLLAFVAAVVRHDRRVPMGIEGAAWLAVVLALCLAWAYLLWWSFERHTDTVRIWLHRSQCVTSAGLRPWSAQEAREALR